MLASSMRYAAISLSILLLGCLNEDDTTVSHCFPVGSCDPSRSSPTKLEKSPVFSADSGNASLGKALYIRLCSSCHGTNGRNSGSLLAVQDLSSEAWQQKKTDAEIRMTLARGKGQMPAFPQLSAKETLDLIRFIRTLRLTAGKPSGSGN